MHALMNSLIEPAQRIRSTVSAKSLPNSRPMDRLTIQIDESYWEPVQYSTNRAKSPCQLYASISINGCPMHFEAYLVDEDGDICDHRHQKAIDDVKAALRDDEQWDTITYNGLSYVVMAIPSGKSG